MKRAVVITAFLMLLFSAALPQTLRACESCADEGTCLPTWSGAQHCTWVEKCRIFGNFPFQTEVCWFVCKQYDYTCSIRPDTGPPRV